MHQGLLLLQVKTNAGKLFGFANDRKMMSKGKVRASACDDKTLKDIFYLVLCLGMFLQAAALFSYNSFLLAFRFVGFLLFCFMGGVLSIF